MATIGLKLRARGVAAVLAAILAAPLPARANVPAQVSLRAPAPAAPTSTDALRGELHRYLGQEKRGGVVLMAMGVPAVALGGGLLAQDRALGRGFAYPVLVIGALELLGGLVFFARTSRQLARLDAGLTARPLETIRAEQARMRRINLQFSLIEALEMTLLVGGIAMAAAGAGTREETLLGVGLGLSVQSAALLTFDLFAARRARRYTHALELTAGPNLTAGMMAPGGAASGGQVRAGGVSVALRGSF